MKRYQDRGPSASQRSSVLKLWVVHVNVWGGSNSDSGSLMHRGLISKQLMEELQLNKSYPANYGLCPERVRSTRFQAPARDGL